MTQPATVKELRAAFPHASDEFLIRAVENDMSVKDAGEHLLRELQAENEKLLARIDEMQAAQQPQEQELTK